MKIMPDFRAYGKQDNMPSYNDLGQDYPIKLPTQTHDEPDIGQSAEAAEGVEVGRIWPCINRM